MARIAGIDIPKNKRGEVALTYIYGIGRSNARSILQQAGVACKLIPTPRYLTSDCGISVRIAREDVEAARKAMDKAGAEYRDVRDLEG